MKTKTLLFGISLFALGSVLVFTACKKKETTKVEDVVPTSDESGQSGSDSRDTQSENDAAVNDINNVVGDTKLLGRGADAAGINGIAGTICGLSIDTTNILTGSILLNYNGTTCLNRTRTGSIKLTLQNFPAVKWKNTGAVIKIDYLNYKIVRASDQKSILLNGTQYLTNVSGGTWVNLVLGTPSLVTTITGTNLNVTFEDNKTAVYNINRKMTYTYPGTVLTCKAEGLGTTGSINNLENFGTTRNNEPFTSEVTTPIVWNMTCGGAVIQGAVNIKVATKGFDLKFTYGVDTNGNPVTVSANNCPYGWKLEWTIAGKSNSKVIGYY